MKLFVKENFRPKELPAKPDFRARFDVIVAGLGTAGAPCAIAAAKAGLRTLGVERWNGLGGQSTLGLVNFGQGDVIDALLKANETAADAAGLVREMGATVIGAWMDGNRIVGVRTLRNGFVADYAAKVVIDASGDASVARMAGCGMRIGRDSDHGQAAVSKTTRCRLADGRFRPCYGFYRDNPETDAESFSRRILGYAVRDLGQQGGASGREVVRKSPLMGAREEGHVVCADTYTLRDAIVGRQVEDPIFTTIAPFDLVRIDGDWAWENEDTVDWKVTCGLMDFVFFASVPYGTLVPKGVEGLLVPSKHYGVAHDAGGGLRMQNHMRFTGLAAAAAAQVAIRKGCALRDVPYAELKPLLDRAAFRAPRKDAGTVNVIHKTFLMEPFDAAKVGAALARPYVPTGDWVKRCDRGPGQEMAWAYFTCWRTHLCGTDAARRTLADALAARLDGAWGGHFAIALGLLRDRRAVPGLRRLAFDPAADGADRIKALAALRRFRDRAALPQYLKALADDAASFGSAALRFQALSYILFSVREILAEGPDAAAAKALADWRARPLVLACGGRDNADLAPQLKAL